MRHHYAALGLSSSIVLLLFRILVSVLGVRRIVSPVFRTDCAGPQPNELLRLLWMAMLLLFWNPDFKKVDFHHGGSLVFSQLCDMLYYFEMHVTIVLFFS